MHGFSASGFLGALYQGSGTYEQINDSSTGNPNGIYIEPVSELDECPALYIELTSAMEPDFKTCLMLVQADTVVVGATIS